MFTNLSDVATSSDLSSLLADYARRWPAEGDTASEFASLLLENGPDPFDRVRLAGHYTGSAWLVDRAGENEDAGADDRTDAQRDQVQRP